MSRIHETILDKLREAEHKHNICVLYAVEAGSHAWGFASEKSDHDVRFLYIHPPAWYLSIQNGTDYIEIKENDTLELCGWDLRKALQLFQKSNPGLLEWLRSPMKYDEQFGLAESLRKISSEYFQPKACMFHYLHMAEGNYKDYLKTEEVRTKKYLYVLRPMLCASWISSYNEFPPMEFETLVETLIPASALKYEVIKLLDRKKSGDKFESKEAKNSLLDPFITEELRRLKGIAENELNRILPDSDKLDGLFLNTLQNVYGIDLKPLDSERLF